MPFVVIYDASVLYPSSLRDLLLRIAQAGLVQARWTEEILDEMFTALKRDRPELDPAKLDRTRELMGTDSWRNPPGSIDDVLDRRERNGLAVTVAELRAGR